MELHSLVVERLSSIDRAPAYRCEVSAIYPSKDGDWITVDIRENGCSGLLGVPAAKYAELKVNRTVDCAQYRLSIVG